MTDEEIDKAAEDWSNAILATEPAEFLKHLVSIIVNTAKHDAINDMDIIEAIHSMSCTYLMESDLSEAQKKGLH